jgi:hypothetical protein
MRSLTPLAGVGAAVWPFLQCAWAVGDGLVPGLWWYAAFVAGLCALPRSRREPAAPHGSQARDDSR